MSAGIEQDGTRATFVAVRDGGWHQLGTVVGEDLDVGKALRLAFLANLDYHTEPVTVPVGGQVLTAEERAVVRRNPWDTDQWQVLKAGVSDRYVVHTPEEVFSFGEQIIDSGHPLSALGSIDKGRRAFAAFRLDGITIGGIDQVSMFLNILTDFTGRMNTIARTSGIRAECMNTFNMILGQREMPTYAVPHRGDPLLHRVDDARRSLDVGWSGLEAFQREAEVMIQREVTAREFDAVVADLIPIGDDTGDRMKANRERDRLAVRALYESSPTVAGIKGTAWGVLNAYTEWADWTAGRFPDASARMVAQIMPGSRIDTSRSRAGLVVARSLGLVGV